MLTTNDTPFECKKNAKRMEKEWKKNGKRKKIKENRGKV
jgi:hypothetical protein